MRMTRAQAAAQAAATDDSPDQSDSPIQERSPLGELTANSEIDAQTGANEQVNGKAHQPSNKHEETLEAAPEAGNIPSPTPIARKTRAQAPLHELDTEIQSEIPIHQDAQSLLDAKSPTVEVAQLNLTPQRTPAKNLMTKGSPHIRSTSNKENIYPNSPLPHHPIQRQDPLPESLLEDHQVHQSQDQVEEDAPARQEEQETTHPDHVEPDHQLTHELEQETESQMEHAPELESKNQTEAGDEILTPAETEVQQEAQSDQTAENEPETQVEPTSIQEPVQEPVLQESPQQELVPEIEKTIETVPSPEVPVKTIEKKKSTPATSSQTNGKAKAPVTAPVKKAPTTISRPETKKPASRPSARPSSIIREPSVRRSTISKPEAAGSAALKRATSVRKPASRPSTVSKEPPNGDDEPQAEKGPAYIPHSKPRPMSMSFPTPPPPPKSSKPPTKSTFQLPGEAVAAKLKAAKEARMKKEEEERKMKPPAFKARPAPSFKDSGAIVRQTATSLARTQGKEAADTGSSNTGGGLKRASTVRESMLKGDKATSTTNKRLSTVPKPGPGLAIRPPRPSTSSISSHKRAMSTPSTTAPNPRTVSNSTSTAPQRITSNGTNKGKEVFGRAVAEKEALEKQRREKEEAAKKARADAAERGRVASREWAAKMKLKKENKDKGNNTAVIPAA